MLEEDIFEAKFNALKNQLEPHLKPKRFAHSLGVVDSAAEMAERFGADVHQAKLAALLHDCAKNFTDEEMLATAKAAHLDIDPITKVEPQLLHGPVGAVVAKRDYGITDPAILSAITYHTTGREHMTLLEKIIYLADFIEPSRDYPGVDTLREACAGDDIDKALLVSFTNTIMYINSIGGLIHPRTVNARNALILNMKYHTQY